MTSVSVGILHRAKPIVFSLVIFTLLLGAAIFAGFVYVLEPGSEGRVRYLQTMGKLLLYKYSLVDSLTTRETKRLYKSTCTKKCHSKEVIEGKPRTAFEWEQIVGRMGEPDRSNLSFNESKSIIEHLQRNYLSNVPTTLPDDTMRFLKKHLWRMDFGDEDIYFDVIYIPRMYRSYMPYLAFRSKPTGTDEAVFIIYVNTHSGEIPSWDLGGITTLKDNQGHQWNATGWDVLYEDGQKHHRQGILTFPELGSGDGRNSLELVIHPKGMRERAYLWTLPVPKYVKPPQQTETGTEK